MGLSIRSTEITPFRNLFPQHRRNFVTKKDTSH